MESMNICYISFIIVLGGRLDYLAMLLQTHELIDNDESDSNGIKGNDLELIYFNYKWVRWNGQLNLNSLYDSWAVWDH